MKKRTGFTLVETCVSIAICSMIMTLIMVMMNRTTRHYKKGTELMNVQILMDSLTERMRNDIKGLRSLKEISEHKLSFEIASGSDKITITYSAEAGSKQTRKGENLFTIKRTQDIGSPSETKMHSEDQIKLVKFEAKDKDGNKLTLSSSGSSNDMKKFSHIEMSMQLVSDVNGEGGYSTMSFVCNFYSNCLDNGI